MIDPAAWLVTAIVGVFLDHCSLRRRLGVLHVLLLVLFLPRLVFSAAALHDTVTLNQYPGAAYVLSVVAFSAHAASTAACKVLYALPDKVD